MARSRGRRSHVYVVFAADRGWLTGTRLADVEDEFETHGSFDARWVKTRDECMRFDSIDDALEAVRDADIELGSVDVLPVPR